MNNWDDLLLTGGFAPRARVLHGLTLEQVAARPNAVPHSIYQELWHAAMAQKFTLEGVTTALVAWPYEAHFPAAPAPQSEREWGELVEMFLADSERAVRLGEDAAWLEAPESPDTECTRRNALEFLAVHNAYHLAKIVSLRQALGLWKEAG